MPTVMHDKPQKPLAGALLSLTTAALWGVLPVALKELLSVMDAGTVVWYRFLVAWLVILVWLAAKQKTAAQTFKNNTQGHRNLS